jgi:hypothetical protein
MANSQYQISPPIDNPSDFRLSASPEEVSHQKYLPCIHRIHGAADLMVNKHPKRTLVAAIVIILAIGGVIGGLAGARMPLSVTVSVGSSLLTVYAVIGIALLIFRCHGKREVKEREVKETVQQKAKEPVTQVAVEENRRMEQRYGTFLHYNSRQIQESVCLVKKMIFNGETDRYVQKNSHSNIRRVDKMGKPDGTYSPCVPLVGELSDPVMIIDYDISFADPEGRQQTLHVPLIYFRICPKNVGQFHGRSKPVVQVVLYLTCWVPHSRPGLDYDVFWEVTPASFKGYRTIDEVCFLVKDLVAIVNGSHPQFQIAS